MNQQKDINIVPAIIAILVILIVAMCLFSPEFAAAVYQIILCNFGPAQCVRIVQ